MNKQLKNGQKKPMDGHVIGVRTEYWKKCILDDIAKAQNRSINQMMNVLIDKEIKKWERKNQ